MGERAYRHGLVFPGHPNSTNSAKIAKKSWSRLFVILYDFSLLFRYVVLTYQRGLSTATNSPEKS